LVVEDNAHCRRAIRQTLAGWGLGVVEAATADEGMQALDEAEKANQPFAAVLLDGSLPGHDSFVILDYLRDHRELTRSIIMMMGTTSHSVDASPWVSVGV
jgi:CheY-like chemotaxis protein